VSPVELSKQHLERRGWRVVAEDAALLIAVAPDNGHTLLLVVSCLCRQRGNLLKRLRRDKRLKAWLHCGAAVFAEMWAWSTRNRESSCLHRRPLRLGELRPEREKAEPLTWAN
jgi:hypothetical protein